MKLIITVVLLSTISAFSKELQRALFLLLSDLLQQRPQGYHIKITFLATRYHKTPFLQSKSGENCNLGLNEDNESAVRKFFRPQKATPPQVFTTFLRFHSC